MIVNGFKSKAAALRVLRDNGFKVAGLLAAPESNPKVAKNGKMVGVLSFPLHLAPANLSGFEVCAQRSAGCTLACLHTAGNPVYMAGKTASRIAKTKAYFTHRQAFMAVLVFEITAAFQKASRAGMECGIRLNATSDIPWERVGVEIDGIGFASVMEAFTAVSFYDYTKITKRALACAAGGEAWPSNYHLTFSKTEANHHDVARVVGAGGNVAVVCSLERYKAAIEHGSMACSVTRPGMVQLDVEMVPVVDGDLHDYRPADRGGALVVLKAKGDAKQDTSGFVVR